MKEEAIDLNLNYIRGVWTLNRFNTVGDFVNFWLSVGPYWGKCPNTERINPWFIGIEESVHLSIKDCK